jgi:hypothetical protein
MSILATDERRSSPYDGTNNVYNPTTSRPHLARSEAWRALGDRSGASLRAADAAVDAQGLIGISSSLSFNLQRRGFVRAVFLR